MRYLWLSRLSVHKSWNNFAHLSIKLFLICRSSDVVRIDWHRWYYLYLTLVTQCIKRNRLFFLFKTNSLIAYFMYMYRFICVDSTCNAFPMHVHVVRITFVNDDKGYSLTQNKISSSVLLFYKVLIVLLVNGFLFVELCCTDRCTDGTVIDKWRLSLYVLEKDIRL